MYTVMNYGIWTVCLTKNEDKKFTLGAEQSNVQNQPIKLKAGTSVTTSNITFYLSIDDPKK